MRKRQLVDEGTFYYRVIPFSLKNVRAIYQRKVTKVFKGLIGKNIVAFVDDILVKSLLFKQHLKDLKTVFTMLRKYKIKLNPTKYVFGIKVKIFLGFIVSKNGIELNPKNGIDIDK